MTDEGERSLSIKQHRKRENRKRAERVPAPGGEGGAARFCWDHAKNSHADHRVGDGRSGQSEPQDLFGTVRVVP